MEYPFSRWLWVGIGALIIDVYQIAFPADHPECWRGRAVKLLHVPEFSSEAFLIRAGYFRHVAFGIGYDPALVFMHPYAYRSTMGREEVSILSLRLFCQ